MTANQMIKKLAKAGIDTTHISKSDRNEIEIWTGDRDETEQLMEQVVKVLPLGGFRSGFGSWVLREGYKVSDLEGLADPMHY